MYLIELKFLLIYKLLNIWGINMKKSKVIEELIVIFWLFIIGSIIGHIFEMTVVLFQKGYFESRRGLLYGPFIPVYGMGVVLYYLILDNIHTEKKSKIYLITMLLGGITEYLCSYIQEKVFGTISWDYSYLTFNINGRTSLLHCTYWGIAGVLYAVYITPLIAKIKDKSDNDILRWITVIALGFMILNVIISWTAVYRQTERKHNIPPKSKIDIFLDKHYPDEFIDKIFANKIDV